MRSSRVGLVLLDEGSGIGSDGWSRKGQDTGDAKGDQAGADVRTRCQALMSGLVGIADPESAQQRNLEVFHRLRLRRDLVIHALGMKHAVHDQVGIVGL